MIFFDAGDDFWLFLIKDWLLCSFLHWFSFFLCVSRFFIDAFILFSLIDGVYEYAITISFHYFHFSSLPLLPLRHFRLFRRAFSDYFLEGLSDCEYFHFISSPFFLASISSRGADELHYFISIIIILHFWWFIYFIFMKHLLISLLDEVLLRCCGHYYHYAASIGVPYFISFHWLRGRLLLSCAKIFRAFDWCRSNISLRLISSS